MEGVRCVKGTRREKERERVFFLILYRVLLVKERESGKARGITAENKSSLDVSHSGRKQIGLE